MPWFPKQRVLVPIDFSAESFEAVQTALQMVPGPEHLSLIHVLPALDAMEPGVVWQTIDNDNRAKHARASLVEKLPEELREKVQVEVHFGDAGHRIADFAQKIEAELIVMPSHGRTGIRRLLIGSVAERVTRLAHCPVLVLRK